MKFKNITVAALVMLFAAPAVSVAAELKDHKQKFSYSVGYRLALSLKAEGLDVDPSAFSAAMKDALSGGKAGID